MDVMSVADFFTVEVWTLRGLVRYHVFFVMNLAKRQVEIAHIGCQVNGAVMTQVARNMTDSCDGILRGRHFFVCDHDSLYTKEFRQILTDSGVEVIQTRVGCPQQNGYAESFVSAIKRECIDHMIFFSEKSLRKRNEYFRTGTRNYPMWADFDHSVIEMIEIMQDFGRILRPENAQSVRDYDCRDRNRMC
tara:strand:- start:104 stop:673 length:570 start_codon:yes stop_codon:yes gene_type:complete